MDPYTKRKIILGEVSIEEAKRLLQEDEEKRKADPDFIDNHYGKEMEMTIDRKFQGILPHIEATHGGKQYSGMHVEASYMGDQIPYFVTESWINGKMIRVDEAFRILEENDKTMKAREVKDMYEKDAVKDGLYKALREHFGK